MSIGRVETGKKPGSVRPKPENIGLLKKFESSEMGLAIHLKARPKWDWDWVETTQPIQARPGPLQSQLIIIIYILLKLPLTNSKKL